jgi:hypothetical protein
LNQLNVYGMGASVKADQMPRLRRQLQNAWASQVLWSWHEEVGIAYCCVKENKKGTRWQWYLFVIIFVCALKWNVSIKSQLERRSVLDIMTLVVSINEMVVIWVICNHESVHESIQGKKWLFVHFLKSPLRWGWMENTLACKV